MTNCISYFSVALQRLLGIKNSKMQSIIAICLIATVAVYAADEKTASVVREVFDLNPDTGAYNYGFETSNGIKFDESGKQVKVGDEFGAAASGTFSYVAADGTKVSLSYTADENGFQPKGDHLPVAPPLPEHVVQLLADLAKAKKA